MPERLSERICVVAKLHLKGAASQTRKALQPNGLVRFASVLMHISGLSSDPPVFRLKSLTVRALSPDEFERANRLFDQEHYLGKRHFSYENLRSCLENLLKETMQG